MIITKSTSQITIMHEGGRHLAEIRRKLLSAVKPGVTPLNIDALAAKLIKKAGGTPSFQTVRDYAWATCISINSAVVHGVPDDRPFRTGDVVNIDVVVCCTKSFIPIPDGQ